MFSKTKKTERIDSEQREQFEYAQRRIKQKKKLVQHLIIFLAGTIVLIIINQGFKFGEEFFIKDWYIWAILIWFFLLLIHIFNVFILNTFMGKEWESLQLEKLKAKQEERIAELDKQAAKEVITEAVIKKREEDSLPEE